MLLVNLKQLKKKWRGHSLLEPKRKWRSQSQSPSLRQKLSYRNLLKKKLNLNLFLQDQSQLRRKSSLNLLSNKKFNLNLSQQRKKWRCQRLLKLRILKNLQSVSKRKSLNLILIKIIRFDNQQKQQFLVFSELLQIKVVMTRKSLFK